MKYIADYTNSYRSRAASTCDSALDYIVLDTVNCPTNANLLETGTNAKTLLGKKVCLLINAFDYTFWSNRYSSDSFACRRARSRIDKYLRFHDELVNSGDGKLPSLISKLKTLESTLDTSSAKVGSNIDSLLRDLQSKAKESQKKSSIFGGLMNCTEIDDQFE